MSWALRSDKLLVAHQLAIAVGGQAMFGPEFLDRQRCRLRAFAQFRQPALQPDRRPLGGVEAGIELIGEIGIGIGFGDRVARAGSVA